MTLTGFERAVLASELPQTKRPLGPAPNNVYIDLNLYGWLSIGHSDLFSRENVGVSVKSEYHHCVEGEHASLHFYQGKNNRDR
jgi:hypothetical protein